jgi:hypothetical protein
MPNLKYIYVSKKRGNPKLIEAPSTAILHTLYDCFTYIYTIDIRGGINCNTVD